MSNTKKNLYPEGLHHSRIYNSWSDMKKRCTYKGSIGYARYGGRGITFDPKWSTFANFYNDMKDGYKDTLTLDRIDNNGNYCKENCRWVDRIVQCNNRSNNRIIFFNGMRKTLTEWSRFCDIKRSTLSQRINYYGWSLSRALGIESI
jgi:hypothetical protein